MEISAFERFLMMYARHFPIRRGKLRVIESCWRSAVGSSGTKRLAALKYGGFSMRCDLAEMLQRQIYFFGTYFVEAHILGCWAEVAKGARVVLDVGANAGIFSLVALAVQPDATVHAFEPTPEIAARLRETARMNGLERLNVHEVAVSSVNGPIVLRRCRGEKDANDGMNFIDADYSDAGAERVRAVSLDVFCAETGIDHIDLLKLDIQGHEYAALRGAERLIGAGRIETIFTELNWAADPSSACSASESIKLLAAAGYEFSAPAQCLRWKQSGDWLRSLSDVVARRTCSGGGRPG